MIYIYDIFSSMIVSYLKIFSWNSRGNIEELTKEPSGLDPSISRIHFVTAVLPTCTLSGENSLLIPMLLFASHSERMRSNTTSLSHCKRL